MHIADYTYLKSKLQFDNSFNWYLKNDVLILVKIHKNCYYFSNLFFCKWVIQLPFRLQIWIQPHLFLFVRFWYNNVFYSFLVIRVFDLKNLKYFKLILTRRLNMRNDLDWFPRRMVLEVFIGYLYWKTPPF